MRGSRERTQVVIVGAGPAGLLLGAQLAAAGIESVLLEARSRAHVEQRQRAGILEPGTVDLLETLGLAARLHREGSLHEGIELRFGGERHRIDLTGLTGGGRVALWPQTEVVKDAIAARIESGAPLHFEVSGVALRDLETARPRVAYTDAHGASRELRCDVVLHTFPGADPFERGLQRAQLEYVVASEAGRTVLAENYVGRLP